MLRSWYVRWGSLRNGRGYSAFGAASSDADRRWYRGELLVDPEPVLLQEYQRLLVKRLSLAVWRKMTSIYPPIKKRRAH